MRNGANYFTHITQHHNWKAAAEKRAAQMTTNIYPLYFVGCCGKKIAKERTTAIKNVELRISRHISSGSCYAAPTMIGKMARKQITSVHKYTSEIRHISHRAQTHSTRCFFQIDLITHFANAWNVFAFPFFRLEFFARIFFSCQF